MTAAELALKACLVTGGYSLALFGAGCLVANLVNRGRGRGTRQIDGPTLFSLGLGLYGIAWILLGLVGRLQPNNVILGVLLGALYAAWSFVRQRHFVRPPITSWVSALRQMSLLEISVGVTLFAAAATLCLASLRPPIGDAVVFYLAWAKVIAASGAITPLPQYEIFSSIWMTAEANFAALMSLGGEAPTKLFSAVCFLVALRATWLLARECGCSLGGCLLAALAVATSTAVTNVAAYGKTDLVAVPPALAATLWALRLGRDPGIRAAVLAGLLGAIAASAKLSYLIPLGVVLGVLFATAACDSAGPARERARTFAKWCIVAGLAGLLVVIPQMIKNAMLFSQPLLPLVGASVGREAWYSPEVTRYIIATLPAALTFGDYWAQVGVLSPLVIGFLPLIALLRPEPGEPQRLLWRITFAATAGIVAWFMAFPSQLAPRYFLAPLLLFAIPAAWAGERAWRVSRGLGVGVLLFALGIGGLSTGELLQTHAKAAWTNLTKRAWLGEQSCQSAIWRDRHCEVEEIVNERANPGERLLLMAWSRYYLRPDILQCLIPFAPSMHLDERLIQKTGMAYVLIDRSVMPIKEPIDERLFELLYEGGDLALYKIRDAFRDAAKGPVCREVHPDQWQVIERLRSEG